MSSTDPVEQLAGYERWLATQCDVAEFLPACVTTARRLRGDPVVPRRAKLALLIVIVWVLSPIDLLPEFQPVIGPLDDVVAVVLLLRYAERAIPGELLHGVAS